MTRARVLVLTCSDTRTPASDVGGARAVALLEEAGHEVTGPAIVGDDAEAITDAVLARCGEGADAIVLTGGTGLAPRDVTLEAVRPLIDKELPGFGEAFRRLSWEQVGARSILSRALAGSRGKTLIVALPGSPRAVELALVEVLLPILGHAVDLLAGRTAHHRSGPARPTGGDGC